MVEAAVACLLIRPGSPLLGKSIREFRIREQARGLIVGVERDGKRILNPESHLVLEQGDTLWIVGNQKRIRLLASPRPEQRRGQSKTAE